MVTDENSGNIVMFGGFHHSGAWGDTWLFDGAHWTAVATPSAPSARGAHAMYYDVALARVMLVGGAVVSGFFSSVDYVNDVWLFDGASWTPTFSLGALPTGRAGHAATYDVARSNAVMLGGYQAEGPLADTWIFADSGWRLIADQPQGGPGSGMVYDSQRGAVLFVSNGTWLFDGAWSKLETFNQPNLAPGFAIAFNSTLHQVVLFGRKAQVSDRNQTWILEGRQWRLLNGRNPQIVEFPALAYDEGRQQLVLFDGARTWHLVGSDWIEVVTAAAPSPRSGYGFAYDAIHGTIVLFGGRSAAGVLLDDTWVFDGSNWVAQPTDVRPTARYGHALTYQRTSGEILLFGGYGEAGPQHDTWLYHDGAWQLLLTAIRPVVRTKHALAHDPVRNRVVLFGGQSATASSLHDTWELTFASASAPPDRCLDASLDSDSDGFAGCADPDCAYRCSPLCPALATCDQPTAPRCGDGVCDSYHLREDALLCPSDCAL